MGDTATATAVPLGTFCLSVKSNVSTWARDSALVAPNVICFFLWRETSRLTTDHRATRKRERESAPKPDVDNPTFHWHAGCDPPYCEEHHVIHSLSRGIGYTPVTIIVAISFLYIPYSV